MAKIGCVNYARFPKSGHIVYVLIRMGFANKYHVLRYYLVDGGWSNWTVGNCSKLCGGGVQNKTRSCSNPSPSCRGKNCVGQAVDVVECNNIPCIGIHINI